MYDAFGSFEENYSCLAKINFKLFPSQLKIQYRLLDNYFQLNAMIFSSHVIIVKAYVTFINLGTGLTHQFEKMTTVNWHNPFFIM